MLLFIGKSFPLIVLFIVSIIYSRYLSYHDNGIFQSIWMYSNILNTMLAFGVTTIIFSSHIAFLISAIKNNKKLIFSFYTLLALLLFLIFFIYEKHYSGTLKILIVVFVILQTAGTLFESICIKQHRESKVLMVNLFYSFAFLAWHLLVLKNSYDLNWLVSGVIGLSLIRLLFLYYFIESIYAYSDQGNRKFLTHWGFIGLNDFTGILSRWLDKIILIYLLSPASFAVFFNGSFEIPLFALMVSVVGNVSTVEISSNLQNRSAIIIIYKTVFNLLSLIVFPLFMFCLFARHELYSVIFDNKYDASVSIFLITIFVLPLRINNYTSILQAYNKGLKILIGSLIDIAVTFLLVVMLYPAFGVKGVALAVVIATYIQASFYMYITAKLLQTFVFKLLPWRLLLIRFLLMLVAYYAVYYFIKDADKINQLIIGSILTSAIILTGLYLFYVEKNNFDYVISKKNLHR